MLKVSDKKPSDDPTLELFAKLFSKTMTVTEKIKYFENSGIDTGYMRKEIETMCNLGEGLVINAYLDGEAKGKVEGEAKQLFGLYMDGDITLEKASGRMKLTPDAFLELCRGYGWKD